MRTLILRALFLRAQMVAQVTLYTRKISKDLVNELNLAGSNIAQTSPRLPFQRYILAGYR